MQLARLIQHGAADPHSLTDEYRGVRVEWAETARRRHVASGAGQYRRHRAATLNLHGFACVVVQDTVALYDNYCDKHGYDDETLPPTPTPTAVDGIDSTYEVAWRVLDLERTTRDVHAVHRA